MKTKLVIFDLDGTLLNTAKNLQFCVNQALKEYGKPPITLKQTVAFVGNGAKKLIERAVGDDESVDDIFNTFMGMMKKYPTHLIKPYAQIKTLLKKLKKSGIKTRHNLTLTQGLQLHHLLHLKPRVLKQF